MSSPDALAWQRVEPLLDRALDLPAAERAAFLEQACGGDALLRSRLERMIAQGEDPDGPLEHSLISVAGPLLFSGDFEPPALLPGEVIGPWRLERELGRGGMGQVYLAQRADGQFAQTAALKLVRRGSEHDPLLVRRFLEERRILAALSHPNIARLLDGGVTAGNLPWFAMEYVPGWPLDRYCDERQLDLAARLALMEQVLGAVAYAHRNLLVHRDLKPSNIFVTEDGQVKLLDFGIAKLLADDPLADTALTQGFGRVMTPEYAAPEQVRGEPVTTATDIYALGAVLYQLLTGQRAHRFATHSAAEIERVICQTNPQTPSQALRAAPAIAGSPIGVGRLAADLDTLVLKALHKEPARRYASADAMLEDLRRFRTGRPLLARPDSVGYRWGKFIGRHRLAVLAGILLALAIVAGVVATVWQARAARLEASRADRVKEFLVDLLHQADPNITQGQEFTVRQLLDRGTHRIDSLLGNEPAVQAELYEVVGNTYAHLGLNEQADTLHRKGLAVVRRLYGPGSEAVLDQEMAVAWGLNDQGHYQDADSQLTRAIADYRKAHGPHGQALSDALDILATARKRLDHPAQAESLYRQSLLLQLRLTGPADTITASRLSDLGALLASQNRLAPAESALMAAQTHRLGVLSPLDVRYLVGESNLAMIQMKRGDLAGAEPRLTVAVTGLTQVEGPGGLNLARALDRKALFEALAFHSTNAVAVGRQAHEMFRTTMGDDHPETQNSGSALAGYQASVGDFRGAELAARAAYAALRHKMGDRHDWTLYAGQRLAAIQLEMGKSRDASATAESVLTTAREKFGKLPPPLAGLLGTAAAAHAGEVDSATTAAAFDEALKTLDGGTHIDSMAYPIIALHYAAFLGRTGASAAGQALRKRARTWIPAGADTSGVLISRLKGQ
ncbi:MAG: serine/threonine-protein kinase [Gemmatimonadota bacterium]